VLLAHASHRRGRAGLSNRVENSDQPRVRPQFTGMVDQEGDDGRGGPANNANGPITNNRGSRGPSQKIQPDTQRR
jgi:hypothetical protein